MNNEQEMHLDPHASVESYLVLDRRITGVEKSQEAHQAALSRIGNNLDILNKDVHEIRVTLRERDGLMGFLKHVFITLLSVFAAGLIGILTQIGVTVWWASTLQANVESVKHAVVDHEGRLRGAERAVQSLEVTRSNSSQGYRSPQQ